MHKHNNNSGPALICPTFYFQFSFIAQKCAFAANSESKKSRLTRGCVKYNVYVQKCTEQNSFSIETMQTLAITQSTIDEMSFIASKQSN